MVEPAARVIDALSDRSGFLMLRNEEFPGDLVMVQRWLGDILGKLQSAR